VFNNFFLYITTFMRCGKTLCTRTVHRLQQCACARHAGYLRLQTHTQNM